MNNQTPPVTSTYFVALVKDYLQGLKTKAEVLTDIAPVQSGLDVPTMDEVTRQIIVTAQMLNEDVYEEMITAIAHATDTTPTREGMLHQLKALLQGDITEADFKQWATWHNEPGTDTGGGFFDDIAVDYFCTRLLPQSSQELNPRHYQKALEIFSNNSHQPLKDKVALVLLTEKEQQRFLFYIGDYTSGHNTPEQLDVYLLNRFGMDHHSFPYMAEITALVNNPAKLPQLLQMAKNGASLV
ncbi:hypothetical protein ACE38W_05315 [Chitinophaga sp. Hz27]|uniref:hypothetical protein n=1 Tax=Chitinophaga sp. Hz27 TaxID=3347169 RepID=UPI0035DA4483